MSINPDPSVAMHSTLLFFLLISLIKFSHGLQEKFQSNIKASPNDDIALIRNSRNKQCLGDWNEKIPIIIFTLNGFEKFIDANYKSIRNCHSYEDCFQAKSDKFWSNNKGQRILIACVENKHYFLNVYNNALNKTGVTCQNSNDFFLKANCVQERKLKVLAVPHKHFVSFKGSFSKQLSGKEVELLRIAAKALNLTLNFLSLDEIQVQSGPERLNNIFAMLNDNKIDLAISALPINYAANLNTRVGMITGDREYIALATPLPRNMAKIWGYFRTYQPDAFIGCTAVGYFSMISIFYLAKTEGKIMESDEIPFLRVSAAILYCFGTFFTQSNDKIGKATPAVRIFAFFFMIATFFVSLTFGGGLASQFSTPPLESPIKSVKDAIMSELTLTTVSKEIESAFSDKERKSAIIGFINGKINYYPPHSACKIMMDVQKRSAAFLDYSGTMEFLIKTSFTFNDGHPMILHFPVPELSRLAKSLPSIHGSIDNPYMDQLDHIIRYLDASGIPLYLEKLALRDERDRYPCCFDPLLFFFQTENGEYKRFTIDDTQGIFLMYCGYMIPAISTFVLELVLSKKKKKRGNSSKQENEHFENFALNHLKRQQCNREGDFQIEGRNHHQFEEIVLEDC